MPEGPLSVRTTSAFAVVVVGLAVVVVGLAVVVVGLAVVVVGLAVVVVGLAVVVVAFAVVVVAFAVVVVCSALVLVARRDDEVEDALATVDVGGTEEELDTEGPSVETGAVAEGCVGMVTDVEDSTASSSPPQALRPAAMSDQEKQDQRHRHGPIFETYPHRRPPLRSPGSLPQSGEEAM